MRTEAMNISKLPYYEPGKHQLEGADAQFLRVLKAFVTDYNMSVPEPALHIQKENSELFIIIRKHKPVTVKHNMAMLYDIKRAITKGESFDATLWGSNGVRDIITKLRTMDIHCEATTANNTVIVAPCERKYKFMTYVKDIIKRLGERESFDIDCPANKVIYVRQAVSAANGTREPGAKLHVRATDRGCVIESGRSLTNPRIKRDFVALLSKAEIGALSMEEFEEGINNIKRDIIELMEQAKKPNIEEDLL